MECKSCNTEIKEADKYCPQCGKAVEKEEFVKYCRKCGCMYENEDMFCRLCGSKREKKVLVNSASVNNYNAYIPIQNDKEMDKERITDAKTQGYQNINTVTKKGSNYFKNPIIWIVSIALFLVSGLLTAYYTQGGNNNNVTKKEEPKTTDRPKRTDPLSNASLEDFKVTEQNTAFMQQQNITGNGSVVQGGDKIYVATNDGIIRYSNTFEEEETITDDYAGDMNIDDTYLYYKNNYDYQYYRVHLETYEEEEVIADDIYYPQLIGNIVYYQKDADNESIYAYNLDTKEETKLNDMRSYELFIDVDKQYIFFLGRPNFIDEETWEEDPSEEAGVYRMDLDGQNLTKLVSGSIYNVRYVDGTLYVQIDEEVYSYDANGENQKLLTDTSPFDFIVTGDTVIYTDFEKVYTIDEDGKETALFHGDTYYIQCVGQYFICSYYDEDYNSSIYVFDLEGNCALLKEEYSSYDYEGWDDYDWDGFDEYEDSDTFHEF